MLFQRTNPVLIRSCKTESPRPRPDLSTQARAIRSCKTESPDPRPVLSTRDKMAEVMMKTGKVRKAMEEYNAITDGRKKKQKRIAQHKVLCLLEDKVKSPTEHCYFHQRDYSAHVLEYVFYRVEKVGVKGLRQLWNKHQEDIKTRNEDAKRYDENLIDMNRPLEVGDIIVDEDDYDEWIVLSLKNPYTAEIKKYKGKKTITIETNNNKEWYEEDDGQDHRDDYEPLCFLTMFKDKNFKN